MPPPMSRAFQDSVEQGKVPLDGPRDQAQHVLIIEDDRDIAQLIATTAESLGLRATPMSTGRDALAILKNEIPEFTGRRCYVARRSWF